MTIVSKIVFAILFLVALLLHEVPCSGQEARSLLQWEGGYSTSGDSTRFIYQFGQGPLKGEVVHCILYYFVDEKLTAADVELKIHRGIAEGSFLLPAATQSFALKFSAGKETDANVGKGYIYSIQQNSKPVRGALGTEAIFRAAFGTSVLALKPATGEVLALLEKERQLYPQQWPAAFSRFYLNVVAMTKPSPAAEATRIIEQAYRDSLAGNYTEISLNFFQPLFFRLKRQDLADSVQHLIARQFPDGEVAYNAASSALREQKTLKEMEQAVAIFLERFKALQSSVSPARQGVLYAMLAEKALEENNREGFWKYVNSMQDLADRFAFCHQLAKQLAGDRERLRLADTLAAMATRFSYERLNTMEGKQEGTSPREWRDILRSTYLDYANIYASIVNKEGRQQQALAIQTQAMQQAGDLAGSDMYNDYLGYLVAMKAYARAFTVAEEMVRRDFYNHASKDRIREVYQQQKHPAEGFDAWFTALEAGAVQKRRDLLQKEMIELPAADFILKDVAGRPVSLASLKGKVVVVDFWATWCGPCKASMPGMQDAVTHFSKDTNVVFLFINTREQTTQEGREKQVKAFLEKQQYSFHVLYDEPADETKKSFKVVDAYKVTGIPTKLVIDQKGQIRFRSVGFKGDNTSLAKEVVVMVDILKSGS